MGTARACDMLWLAISSSFFLRQKALKRSPEASGGCRFEVAALGILVYNKIQRDILLLHSAFANLRVWDRLLWSLHRLVSHTTRQGHIFYFISNTGKFPAVANLPVKYRYLNMSAAFFFFLYASWSFTDGSFTLISNSD